MEKVIFGIIFAPFLLIIAHIVLSISFKTIVMVSVDALSMIGIDGPKRYVSYEWGI